MPAPNAPVPLRRQIQNAGTIVVTVPLQSLSANFSVGGTTFNNGNPTATYTIAANASATGGPITSNSFDELCDLLERLQREGDAVVT